MHPPLSSSLVFLCCVGASLEIENVVIWAATQTLRTSLEALWTDFNASTDIRRICRDDRHLLKKVLEGTLMDELFVFFEFFFALAIDDA